MIYSNVYWVQHPFPGRLGLMARPRGGDWLADDVRALKRDGVSTVVSLLEPHEEQEFDLAGEEDSLQLEGIQYLAFPIPDRGTPGRRADAVALSDHLLNAVNTGESVVIHCRQGIGRAALIACAVMIRSGCTAAEAIRAVSMARGREVPETEDQARWLRRLETERT